MTLEIDSEQNAFTDAVLSQLAETLPHFIATRRWFRSKTRQIERTDIRDVLNAGDGFYILVCRLQFADGEADDYVLAAGFGAVEPSEHVIADYRTHEGKRGKIYEAFSDASFRTALLDAIACQSTFGGQNGDFIALQTSAFDQHCENNDLNLKSEVSKAEQSNTSIIYGDRFILKLFRKLEAGTNPDVEIGVFLTEQGFKNTPAVLGTFEYRAKNTKDSFGAGILQQFVRNRGDAWKYTLGELEGFFQRALSGKQSAPELEESHPLELMNRQLSSSIQDLLGDYAASARLLGIRTAQMHAALASGNENPDFAPEPYTPEDGVRLYKDMLSQAEIAFELLRRKQAALSGTAAQYGQTLLKWEHHVTERFSALRDQRIDAIRIRFHGDYHLGQVLYTGGDFMIIDFEGEPARPLNERRMKGVAMRDVAGMIRSFQYAAYAALFGQVPGVPTDPGMTATVESWANLWTIWATAIYLQGYFHEAASATFVPRDLAQRKGLLDAFVLHKALYEVAYELNNRPDWVRIPLRGILSLLGGHQPTRDAAAN